MQGRTWRRASRDQLAAIRDILVRRGATADKDLSSPHELWRVRIEHVVFTAYTSGTLYCNGGGLPELAFLYESIERVLGAE